MRFIVAVNALLRPFDARLVRASTYRPAQAQMPEHGLPREIPAAEGTARDSIKEPASQPPPESGGAFSTSGPEPQGAVPAPDTTKSNPGHCAWLMLRGSGTEPILRIYAETSSRATTQALLKFGTRLTRSI